MEWWGDAMSCNCEKRLNKLDGKLNQLISLLERSFGSEISKYKYFDMINWEWSRPHLVTEEELQALYDHLGLRCYKEPSTPAKLVVLKRPKTRKGGK